MPRSFRSSNSFRFLCHHRLVAHHHSITMKSKSINGLRLVPHYMATPTTIRMSSRNERLSPVVSAVSLRFYGLGFVRIYL